MHRIANPARTVRVRLSTPVFGGVAQLGERLLCKQRVAGSKPVTSTSFGALAQLVRAPACHAGGHGFKSRTLRQLDTRFSGNGRALYLGKSACACRRVP